MLSKDSDQPAHWRSLIRIFTGHISDMQGHIFDMQRMQSVFMRTKKTLIRCWMCRLVCVFFGRTSEGTFSHIVAHKMSVRTLANTVQCTKKGPHAICGQCRSRSACPSVQSNLGIFCWSIYTTVSTDSVSRQRRHRSACVYELADQGLHCLQFTLGPFFMCCASNANQYFFIFY